MFIIALKIDHSFLGRDIETRLIISTTTSTQLALMRWNRNRCKFKHAQTSLLQSRCMGAPFRPHNKIIPELHSHTM